MNQRYRDPKYVAKTLRWVNRLRRAHKIYPLRRLPRSGHCNVPCSLERALPFIQEMQRYRYLDQQYVAHPIPRYVTQFVKALDAWKLPNYCAEERDEGTA